MLQGTWSTPLTQHIAETRQNAAREFKAWMIKMLFFFTCPFVFAATAAPSAGFSTAASSFTAVLEICAPMLFLVQQRNPTDQLIEQRPQASSRKFKSSAGTSFSNRSRGTSPRPKMTANGRVRTRKMWQRRRRNANSFNFFFPRAEFVNGEIGPAANEMRSTTPKSTDEWALGL